MTTDGNPMKSGSEKAKGGMRTIENPSPFESASRIPTADSPVDWNSNVAPIYGNVAPTPIRLSGADGVETLEWDHEMAGGRSSPNGCRSDCVR